MGMFGDGQCKAPQSGDVKTLRKAKMIWDQEEKHNCPRSLGVWVAYTGAFLSSNGSIHQRSMDVCSQLF